MTTCSCEIAAAALGNGVIPAHNVTTELNDPDVVRDDARRAQLEQDVVLRLELVRPDLVVRFPLDGAASSAGVRGGDYGRILVQVGDRAVETFSTSRRELITLLFEAAQRPMPAWEYPPYAGHPQVLGGGARSAVAVVVYLLIPLLLGAVALTKPGERAR